MKSTNKSRLIVDCETFPEIVKSSAHEQNIDQIEDIDSNKSS